MITLEDCLAFCGLTEEEVLAIAEHEHMPEIAAAAFAEYPSGRLARGVFSSTCAGSSMLFIGLQKIDIRSRRGTNVASYRGCLLQIEDPQFWRAGAISIVVVMMIVLVMLTVDSLMAIDAGGSHVPLYSVINQKIGYKFDAARGFDVPTIGEKEPLFGREYSDQDATDLIGKGKLVIQSRACIDCHTFFGNGAYYGPDLTKAWLDPAWQVWKVITGSDTQEEAMVRFLMDPVRFRTWTRTMPNLHLSRDEAVAVVAYLKWLSAIDTNGFPANFGHVSVSR